MEGIVVGGNRQNIFGSEPEEKQSSPVLLHRDGKIRTADPAKSRGIKIFLILFLIVGCGAMYTMNLDWAQLAGGISQIPAAIAILCEIDFYQFDVTFSALFESIAVSILATIYSLILGMFLAVFMARNITPFRWLPPILSAFFTFLRAIPSTIWVLLILVCVGFGPTAGIIGMSISSMAFFAKSMCQCFEEVSNDTIEALKAMGAGKIKIFFRAILPSAFTSLLAWTSINFESNFESSIILGTVGGGGIGYVVSNCMGRYSYGQAMVAILLMLAFTYIMEIGFTVFKERKK